jgi:hypothetical protein
MSKKRIVLVLCLAGSLLFTNTLKSQVAWENQNSEIYNYLYRMAQKGLIRFDDQVRPLSRVYLESRLDSLQAKSSLLSITEKKELSFYQKEFSDTRAMNYMDSTVSSKLFRKDEYGRWRAMTFTARDFVLRIDPILTAATIQGSGKNITQTSAGFNLHGYAGKHWGYYVSFNDVTESGTGIDTLRQFTPTTGTVGKIATNGKSYNYSELRGGISYGWKNGSISLVQDQLLNGYGENGRIILSSKAPTYPYLRLDYTPFSWFSFNYTHAWLNSNIIDTGNSYLTGIPGIPPPFGGQRILYVHKYMAQHSLRFTPTKGLDITVGESMVYSDALDVAYFIPVLFFKAYDNLSANNNINANSNSQLFLQVSSKNNLPKTHLYGGLFIDEIRTSEIFNPSKSRNQLGFNLGGSITDVMIPYLTLGLEYTRINPFVYRNLLPSQNYTHSDYLMGDWMGNNADRWIASVKYTPIPKLKCMLRYQALRKGSPGTLDQQYFQEPQPPFLFDLLTKQQEWHFQCSYEWINKVYLTGYYNSLHINNIVAGTKKTETSFSLGVSYGL